MDDPRVLDVTRRYWGYDALRPLQSEAISAALAGRDSVVVMPTGGGKSLCYQVPPAVTGGLCVVVSPLIALMQDQCDGLRLAGYPAAALHGHTSRDDAMEVRARVSRGELRLLLVSPERLLMESGGTLAWLANLKDDRAVTSFAVDEAHCISQWGHDFRPEYRRLAELREVFPGVPFHAFTATATPRVRADIAVQLALHDPVELVGVFDRPNLTYRVVPRGRVADQVADVLSRHRDSAGEQEAAIVYCISRKDTEEIAAALKARGITAKAYHAGMDKAKRTRVQSEFKSEKLSVVCATVAFGMGIDRGDVRCVIHAAMPKTIEHYQQETGRAGRDGLPSECVMLFSPGDPQRWRGIIERGAAESENPVPPEATAAQVELVREMSRVVSSGRCRHAVLSEYFGQAYVPPEGGAGCGACDICLGEVEAAPDSTDTARKVLSCVVRVGQAFGAGHVADVLIGKATEKVVARGHQSLSTFGLLRTSGKPAVLSYIEQLTAQGLLERTTGEYPIVKLGRGAKDVLKGERPVALVEGAGARWAAGGSGGGPREGGRPSTRSGAQRAADAPELNAEERALFDDLRALRRSIAEELQVPPFVVLGDATLEEMARVRPGSLKSFACIRGIGSKKLAEFGERFVDRVGSFCRERGMRLDAAEGSRRRRIE